MALATSPLAPDTFPSLPPVGGVTLASAAFGLRYKNRPDILLVRCDAGTAVAGVFTRSTTAAAPVIWCREQLATHDPAQPVALLVNAGQANAFTGTQGRRDIEACAQHLATLTPQLFVSSTGVIGQRLPMDKLLSQLPALPALLSPHGWEDAAEAIRTTDTYPKRATRSVHIHGRPVTINGIAKGSGMIAPDMATLLAYVFTDAAIEPATWQRLLADANARSFNCITVDGDSSTNDTLLGFATGAAGNLVIDNPHGTESHDFRLALQDLLIELAQLVVRDGEGAQKFITVHVNGAASHDAAHRIALSIANSPLIKTAIAGEDANWGRVVMAIGKTREPVAQEDISIAFGEHIIARGGAAIPGYDEAPVAAYMKGRSIDITVEVGHGMGEAKVWTCDLTHGYIDINADYRS